MKRTIAAAILVALVGATGAGVGAASAATIGFNFGNITLGYSDGYWDNHHRWHTWRRGEAARFRAEHHDMYHAWRHDDRRHR